MSIAPGKLPTVRIEHPNNPKIAMLINASDYRPKEHKLWPEQDKDFVLPPTPVQDPKIVLSEEGVVSIRLIGKMMKAQLGLTDEQWDVMTSEDRIAAMVAEEPRIDGALSAARNVPPPAFKPGGGTANWKKESK